MPNNLNDKTIDRFRYQLESLNERLQGTGFSWQHSDYFLLKETLPLILEEKNHANQTHTTNP